MYVAFLFLSEQRERGAGQMSDDRDQMGTLTATDGGGRLALRMRCILRKMTTFDDFLTTF
jgi:hypothetical protein